MPDTREPFASAIVPFSQHERERAEEGRRHKLRLGLALHRRRAAERYDVPGNQQTKDRDLRIMGESE